MEAREVSSIKRLDPWTMLLVPPEGVQRDVSAMPTPPWEFSAEELDAIVDSINGSFNLGEL